MNLSAIDDRLTYYNARFQLWSELARRTEIARLRRAAIRESICSPEAHQADTEQFRREFLDSIGGLPEGSGPVVANCQGEIAIGEVTLRKMILQPREAVYMTAHLYLPPLAPGERAPAVLLLCGHSNSGKSVERYQSIARRLVARGMIVLVPDPTGQGERLNYYDPKEKKVRVRPGTGDHEYNGPQCRLLGTSLIRYFLHDAIRAIDFLAAHPQVDTTRIGITGSSGGGMQTSLMLLVEPRLAAAAPTTFISSRKSIYESGYGQDAEQIWPGFSRSGYEHADLLAAFAPKPLQVQAVRYDFFPFDGTRTTVEEARPLWRLYGAEDRLRLVEDTSVHRYTDALGEAAARFFCEVFGLSYGEPIGVIEPLPEAEVAVTRSGQVTAEFPDARTIHDEILLGFQCRANREQAIAFLHAAVHRDREPVSPALRITRQQPCGEIVAHSAFWWSQRGLINSGILLRPDRADSTPPGVTIALWEDGTRAMKQHDRFIRDEVAKGRAVLVINLTGMGPLEPPPYNSETDAKTYHGSFFRICDDLTFLGDSFAALRTYDLLNAPAALAEWPGLDHDDLCLYLHGPYGIYGALASLLEPRLGSGLRWDHRPLGDAALLRSRYYNDRDIKSLILPGLLRYADWSDLIALETKQPSR